MKAADLISTRSAVLRKILARQTASSSPRNVILPSSTSLISYPRSVISRRRTASRPKWHGAINSIFLIFSSISIGARAALLRHLYHGSFTSAFMRRHPCPGTFSLISRSFYCTGIFCGLSRKTHRNFFPPKKEPGAPGFSPVLRRLLFSSALQPSKTCLTDCFCPCSQKCFPWCCSCSGSSEYFQNYSCWSVSVCNRSWP